MTYWRSYIATDPVTVYIGHRKADRLVREYRMAKVWRFYKAEAV